MISNLQTSDDHSPPRRPPLVADDHVLRALTPLTLYDDDEENNNVHSSCRAISDQLESSSVLFALLARAAIKVNRQRLPHSLSPSTPPLTVLSSPRSSPPSLLWAALLSAMSSQSLPSFAQAFSALDDRDRALPPIHSHTHSPYLRHDSRHEARHDSSRGPSLPPLKRESKKRAREQDDSPDLSSPSIVKQEQDIDQLEPSPPPQPPPPKAPSPSKPTRIRQQLHLNTSIGNNNNNAGATTNSNATATNTNVAAPPPQSIVRQHHPAPPSKRRRVTISGVAHPSMHASNYTFDPGHASPPPSTHTGPSTPISPVVMGFTIQRDPQAVEQVRAMLAVKQQQKAIIESRRGSAAGLAGNEGSRRGSIVGADSVGRRASVAAPSVTVNVVNPTPTTATGPGPAQTPAAPPLRRTGSSPNGHRLAPTPPTMSPKARANAARTRSPSLLGGARVSSPSQHGVSSRAAALPPTSTSANSNLSPPSHHPTRPQPSPQTASGRPQMPSPPQPAPPSASPSTNNSQNQQSSPYGANQGFSALANNLPPPPNSFTRRRTGQLVQRGNKPADLMISPRETESGPVPSGHKTSGNSATPRNPPHTAQAQPQQQMQTHHRMPPQRGGGGGGGAHVPSVHVSSSFRNLQPAIQSAPPRPGQQPGRFPMALPTLPPALGAAVSGGATQRTASIRKAGGQVPPTPTRLSMQRAQGTAESAPVRLSHPTGLSRVPRTATGASFAVPHGPAAASGAGSSSLAKMPGTPATLHRASGAGASTDKAAFLAPFEQFFDALSDAQVLKGWFGEQLRRVGALAKESDAQVTRLKAVGGENSVSRSEVENLVREAVQQEARAWRDEVVRLRTQMAEMQETIQDLRSTADANSGTAKGKGRPVNGLSPRPQFQPTPPTSSASTFPTAPGVESYTFPPVPRPGPVSGGAASSALMHTANPRNELPSPPPGRDTSDSMSGYGRSVSRSAASSPAPSFDGGVGISRRLSVSAMRFEPQKQLPLVLVDRNDTLEENKRERRREMEKKEEKEKEKGKQGEKMPGGSGSGSRTNVGGGGGDVGSVGRSDERHDSSAAGAAAAVAESPMDDS